MTTPCESPTNMDGLFRCSKPATLCYSARPNKTSRDEQAFRVHHVCAKCLGKVANRLKPGWVLTVEKLKGEQ